jgi:hypothetical protein
MHATCISLLEGSFLLFDFEVVVTRSGAQFPHRLQPLVSNRQILRADALLKFTLCCHDPCSSGARGRRVTSQPIAYLIKPS